ncbi:hypothetical protein CAPTEDRAFT_192274 [Capitella teleta]|uniref:Uncharacterized protein n=1 Tax=Capitella teleta TaxID=283909 RepID=R7U9P6_CAPTE|nr:hypothetical protein CAPTEDRAFT_192274 [Capitella teleta]|eukprot:ELU03085.1 hypothetical protein CAPTEDRAFT_192274 [Capitella teleta]
MKQRKTLRGAPILPPIPAESQAPTRSKTKRSSSTLHWSVKINCNKNEFSVKAKNFVSANQPAGVIEKKEKSRVILKSNSVPPLMNEPSVKSRKPKQEHQKSFRPPVVHNSFVDGFSVPDYGTSIGLEEKHSLMKRSSELAPMNNDTNHHPSLSEEAKRKQIMMSDSRIITPVRSVTRHHSILKRVTIGEQFGVTVNEEQKMKVVNQMSVSHRNKHKAEELRRGSLRSPCTPVMDLSRTSPRSSRSVLSTHRKPKTMGNAMYQGLCLGNLSEEDIELLKEKGLYDKFFDALKSNTEILQKTQQYLDGSLNEDVLFQSIGSKNSFDEEYGIDENETSDKDSLEDFKKEGDTLLRKGVQNESFDDGEDSASSINSPTSNSSSSEPRPALQDSEDCENTDKTENCSMQDKVQLIFEPTSPPQTPIINHVPEDFGTSVSSSSSMVTPGENDDIGSLPGSPFETRRGLRRRSSSIDSCFSRPGSELLEVPFPTTNPKDKLPSGSKFDSPQESPSVSPTWSLLSEDNNHGDLQTQVVHRISGTIVQHAPITPCPSPEAQPAKVGIVTMDSVDVSNPPAVSLTTDDGDDFAVWFGRRGSIFIEEKPDEEAVKNLQLRLQTTIDEKGQVSLAVPRSTDN